MLFPKQCLTGGKIIHLCIQDSTLKFCFRILFYYIRCQLIYGKGILTLLINIIYYL